MLWYILQLDIFQYYHIIFLITLYLVNSQLHSAYSESDRRAGGIAEATRVGGG